MDSTAGEGGDSSINACDITSAQPCKAARSPDASLGSLRTAPETTLGLSYVMTGCLPAKGAVPWSSATKKIPERNSSVGCWCGRASCQLRDV